MGDVTRRGRSDAHRLQLWDLDARGMSAKVFFICSNLSEPIS
jgi:hypothetical protein